MSSTPPNETERLAQLEALLNSAVDAIITINEQGLVESANPATETLFGYDVDEIIGHNVNQLMPTPYHEEHDGYLQNYLTSGLRKIIGVGREVVGLRKDGSTFPMHLAVSEIRVGTRRLFTGIVRDITDLKQAEEELRRLNEELEERVQDRTRELHATQAELVKKEKLATLGQVSGGIAHEIRNPLNAVKSSAYYLLNARNPSAEKTREHLNRIDRQVTIIDNVITALSDVARLPEPRLEPANIERVVRAVARSVSLPSTITLEWQWPESVSDVLVDENQIPIVFRNLVRNARDAMPDGGSITMSAAQSDGVVVVSVTDTGIGIPAEDLGRVTEPLYSTKARGMGLGLAISNAIVEKNGGRLEITSKVNEGSTFSVVLRTADGESGGVNDA